MDDSLRSAGSFARPFTQVILIAPLLLSSAGCLVLLLQLIITPFGRTSLSLSLVDLPINPGGFEIV